MKDEEKVIDFLIKNGYQQTEVNEDHKCFLKDELMGVDVNEREMVFIDDSGDFLHLPVNYFSLIGVLIHYRQLPVNYKF